MSITLVRRAFVDWPSRRLQWDTDSARRNASKSTASRRCGRRSLTPQPRCRRGTQGRQRRLCRIRLRVERNRGVHQHTRHGDVQHARARDAGQAHRGTQRGEPECPGPARPGQSDAREVRRGHRHGRESGAAQPAVRRCGAAANRTGASARGQPRAQGRDLARARKSFNEFEEQWDAVEDLVKIRSREAYRRDRGRHVQSRRR